MNVIFRIKITFNAYALLVLDKLRLVVKNYLFKDSFLLISVNICLYNSTKYIQETLDSVFSQTYQDFEVIAIDDGSSDGTYEFIKERYNDPRLKLYRQDNHGLGYTRNRCAELSVGEYIKMTFGMRITCM